MAEDEGPARSQRSTSGSAYGSDQNGLSSQPHPREGPNPVQYPFKSFDGRVTFQRQRSGEREFDITKDGVAHYGLFPDWWEDIRRVGGAAAVKDMARGAEAYLQSWERVNGIRFGCKSPRQRFASRGTRPPAPAQHAPPSCCAAAASPGCAATGPGSGAFAASKNRRKKVAVGAHARRHGGAGREQHAGQRPAEGPRGRPRSRLRGRTRKMGTGLLVRRGRPEGRASSTACAAAASASWRWPPGRRRRTARCCAATWRSPSSAEIPPKGQGAAADEDQAGVDGAVASGRGAKSRASWMLSSYSTSSGTISSSSVTGSSVGSIAASTAIARNA